MKTLKQKTLEYEIIPEQAIQTNERITVPTLPGWTAEIWQDEFSDSPIEDARLTVIGDLIDYKDGDILLECSKCEGSTVLEDDSECDECDWSGLKEPGSIAEAKQVLGATAAVAVYGRLNCTQPYIYEAEGIAKASAIVYTREAGFTEADLLGILDEEVEVAAFGRIGFSILNPDGEIVDSYGGYSPFDDAVYSVAAESIAYEAQRGLID